MTLTFAGTLDHAAIVHAVDQLVDLVGSPEVAALWESESALPQAAGPATYVPWQACALQIDDFLVCRLMEIVVHADDLAASVGLPTPEFADEVLDPVVSLLAALSVRRHGQAAVVRALARADRSDGPISALQGPRANTVHAPR